MASLDNNGTVTPTVSALDEERATLRDALNKVLENDHRDAQAGLRVVVESPLFAALSNDERHSALYFYGALLVETGEFTQAHALLKRATSMDEATGIDWYERLDAAAKIGDEADELTCLTQIAERWPASLEQINDHFIAGLAFRTNGKSELAEARFAALEALANVGWKPADLGLSTDDLWLDLADTLLARNQLDAAETVAKLVATPMGLVALRADKHFDPIVAKNSPRFEVEATMVARLAALRAAAKASPEDLAAANALADEFLSQNKPNEALAFLDEIVAKTKTSAGGSPQFSNSEKLTWILDGRARAFVMLGRDEDAVSTLKTAARRPEGNVPNVSQTLNLGQVYMELGRTREALETIDDVGDMSGYGRMDQEGVRACSYAQMHEVARLDAALKFMKEHRADAPLWVFEALLCAGDEDGAAEFLKSELADARARRQFLVHLQSYAPIRQLPFAAEVSRRRMAVRARPDVQKAIQAVGRVEAYPLSPDIL